MPAPAVAPDLEFGLFLEGEGAAEVDGEVAVLVEGSAAIAAFVVWGAAAVTGVIGMAG